MMENVKESHVRNDQSLNEALYIYYTNSVSINVYLTKS